MEDLGVDPGELTWRRSGEGADAIEIAFVRAGGEQWVLMRVAAHPSGLVHVFSAHEWRCFLDGVRNGEFDDAAL
ncbi:DUF397 domain-containing protein [Sphaerisporangium fuscum]|uniref:DUF397 domain-containing protein n=1 Tax=Sphaerisporangium fuscum TaxID=2835868 RepID=UPI001BDC7891|nr:DUF397 domain-containing protein [Sphaerisporangium fuscum]